MTLRPSQAMHSTSIVMTIYVPYILILGERLIRHQANLLMLLGKGLLINEFMQLLCIPCIDIWTVQLLIML